MNGGFLTKKEREKLQALGNRLKKVDGKACVRVYVILGLDEGLTYETMENILGISEDTMRRYKNKYISGGVGLLLENHYKAYAGHLSEEELQDLDKRLSGRVYTTTKAIAQLISGEYGYKYSESQVSRILHKLGYSYKKPKPYPYKADRKKQEACVEKIEGHLAQSTENKSVVLFADSVHPLHNTKPGYGWIKKGTEKWLPSNSGRKRYSLTGVIHATKPEQVTLLNAKSINEDVIIGLLKQVKQRYSYYDKVHIWSGRAAYYTSKKVKKWLAQQDKVELHYLPPSSPNLNLIERLWKFMRKKVINHNFYETYDEFIKAIQCFFSNIKVYKVELRSLITPNFQLF